MTIELKEEALVKVKDLNGISIYRIHTEKFKTNSINIFFHDNISYNTVTKNAIIPAVLRRGTLKYPTSKDISIYLEELYGASFDCGVTKKGEQQIMQFYIDTIMDKYTSDNTSLLKNAFDLLYQIITEPILENNMFKEEYLNQEKENLKMLIESRVNDKITYAVDRCFEEMCKDEPFGIYDYGTVDALANLSNLELYKYYLYVLEYLPISVYISGDVQEDDINYIVNKFSTLRRGSLKQLKDANIHKEVTEVKNVIEPMNVLQGKLSMGFRTNISSKTDDYYKLMLYNSILGGGVHSKLFLNVREKASLAYYAFSRLEKLKGLMIIGSGIEIKNKDKAIEIILEQMKEIENGNISEIEYQSSIKSIETGINSLKDSQMQIVDFYLSQQISGTNETLDSIIEKIKKVTIKDVIDISKKIKLDTIYFLTQN